MTQPILTTDSATTVFEALASPPRLAIFKLLVKLGDTGMVAGDISQQTGLPPTNLSFHLKTLLNAKLISVTQEGRFLRYRANIPLMLDVIAYLTEECCAGNPERCEAYRAASRISPSLLPHKK